ncbi:MAG: hypothetical protein ABI480_10810 [Chitinophagaceae bacterium]
MKKILALTLLLAFASQTFSQAIIVIDFYINQSYIATFKCENRFMPMLHCNGKCVLAKRLKQEEKREQENSERKLENKNEVISSKSFFTSVLPSLQTIYPVYQTYSDKRITGVSFAVFHPPCA